MDFAPSRQASAVTQVTLSASLNNECLRTWSDYSSTHPAYFQNYAMVVFGWYTG